MPGVFWFSDEVPNDFMFDAGFLFEFSKLKSRWRLNRIKVKFADI